MVYLIIGFSYLVAIYAIGTHLRAMARQQTTIGLRTRANRSVR